MKKVVNPETLKVISIDEVDLFQGKPAAYRMRSDSNSYAILAKLNNGSSYGFIPLNCSTSTPRYRSEYFDKSIREASKARDVYIFNSYDEMIEAMYKKSF